MPDIFMACIQCIIIGLCVFAVARGLKTKKPPFQKGLKGTKWEESALLCKFQVALATGIGLFSFYTLLVIIG